MNAAVIRRGAGYAEAIMRQSDNGAAATSHGNRLIEDEVFAFGILLDRLSLLYEVHEVFSRAVKDRWLAGVHLDNDIIDTTATEGTEYMLDSVDFGMAISDGSASHEFVDKVDQRLKFGLTKEVDAAKDDAGVLSRGLQSKVNLFTRVQGFTLDRDFPQNGALFHKK